MKDATDINSVHAALAFALLVASSLNVALLCLCL